MDNYLLYIFLNIKQGKPLSDIFTIFHFAIENGCDDVEGMKDRIVDECIARMSPSCIDILTMFYYKDMSLDEILAAREENTSKDGLKTAKNKCLNTLKAKVNDEFMKNCIYF